MLLAIDAGNTNITFALYESGGHGAERSCRHVWRCASDHSKTSDEYAAWLYQLFTREGIDFGDVDDVIIASVVPDANYNFRTLCRNYFGVEGLIIGQDPVDPGIKIDISAPGEAGADRIVNAVAVVKYYSYPAIVIDFGTATTFDVIDASGAYCGGAIAPGPGLSLDALHAAAAKLPKISITRTQSVIGRDTVGAMQSGLYWGYTSMIEGMIVRIGEELGADPFVLATGGLACLFGEGVTTIDHIDPDLTLKGLVSIYSDHEKQSG